MSARIRKARPGEEAALVPLYQWLFAPPGALPSSWDPEAAGRRLAEAIAGERSVVLLADDEGRLIGFCTAYLDLDSVRFGQRCWVEDLAVHPERRSAGVGKALLDAARSWARDRGASHLELASGLARTDAHRFYEREGPSWASMHYAWVLTD